MASPSDIVWTGLIARASPSCALVARRLACAFVSFASVATTPIVVFVPGSTMRAASPSSNARRESRSALPPAVRAPAMTRPVSGSITSPTALHATIAPTVTPCALTAALPMPPFIARSMPNTLPTAAPAPAPTLPSAGGRVVAARQAS